MPAESPGGSVSASEVTTWPGRLVADESLELIDDGRVLIGGSPLKVLRFNAPIDLDDVRAAAVVERLVDTGMAHPDPTAGPWSASDVTVVIPVYGQAPALAETLAALSRSVEGPTEILVVDDGSPDSDAIAATVALAGSRSTRLIRLDQNQGAAAARNAGLEAVTTPLVAFLDAGCVPRPGWLAPILTQFADPRVALVAPRVSADPDRWSDAAEVGSGHAGDHSALAGRIRTAVEGRLRRAISRYETTRSSLDMGPDPARVAPRSRVSYVPSACVVADAASVRKVGGFDEALRVGEDVDLVWRLAEARRVRYVPDARVSHDVRTRLFGFLGRRFAYGTSAAPLSERHPRGPVPVQVSPWSAAAWGALAVGHPAIGVGIGATSVGLLVRKLEGLDAPLKVALRLAGMGNLAAGGLLANAIRRPWWPLAMGAAVIGPRSVRRTVLAAFVIPPLLEWRPDTGLDPLSWLTLSTLDDLAYGTGVWAGCIRNHTITPLAPDLSAGRVT